MGMARHTLNTQTNKNTVSLQYLKKELSYEVDVLHVGKHECLLQVIILFLMGLARFAQNTQASLQSLYNMLRKKLGMKWGT